MKTKTYKITGECIDAEWLYGHRLLLERYMLDDIRAHGYLPVLDADIALTAMYFDETTARFRYELTTEVINCIDILNEIYYGYIAGEDLLIGPNGVKIA